ncbi:MAG: hypothetical protein V4772_07745 [Pseudomonadota bacterium]
MKTPSIKKSASAQAALLVLSMLLAAVSLPASALDPSNAVLQQRTEIFYTASLHPASEFASAGDKQLRVVMLRDVHASEIADVLARGMAASASDEELAKLVPVLFGLGEMFGQQKTLAAGDSLLIDGSAAKGMRISIQAKGGSLRPELSFSQPGAFGVMQRLWLGVQSAGMQLPGQAI